MVVVAVAVEAVVLMVGGGVPSLLYSRPPLSHWALLRSKVRDFTPDHTSHAIASEWSSLGAEALCESAGLCMHVLGRLSVDGKANLSKSRQHPKVFPGSPPP